MFYSFFKWRLACTLRHLYDNVLRCNGDAERLKNVSILGNSLRRLAASDVIIGTDDDTEADSDRDEKRRAAALQSAAEGAAEMHIDWLSDTTLHVFSERARVGEEK